MFLLLLYDLGHDAASLKILISILDELLIDGIQLHLVHSFDITHLWSGSDDQIAEDIFSLTKI